MNTEQGFTLHPGAAQDIPDIWEFIVEDNPLAARRVREDILDAVRKLVLFPHQGHKRPDLTTKPYGSKPYATTSSPTHRTKSRLWCSLCWMVAAALAYD
ncbi:MAG TPA: type II toxin-antitoxin system RelE/ParE family toxin [Candidatus Acidoferrales bacterium]|jgi:plasmid stabilization system protein ParE|nr:type II toxin-antitoxin system RelE/ParE family toxin [Candidatus Acidoferrales bacterium]